MGLIGLVRRFADLKGDERGYYLRRFVDLQLHARPGFSQFGEDASVAAFLRNVGRACHFYLDIGANHPVRHSNTWLFYRDGASGLVVEANPMLARRLRRRRPRDTVVNVGVLPEGSGTMELQIMDFDGLSTMSPEWGERVASTGMARAQRRVTVPVIGINDLLRQHVSSKPVDFASIDIEGLDFDVLSAWDFDAFRPFLLCAETTEANAAEYRREERVYGLMKSRGYEPLFETFANTIFIDRR